MIPSFFYVGKEVLALFQSGVYLACAVIDNAYRGLYWLVLQDKLIDGVLFAVIVCVFLYAI